MNFEKMVTINDFPEGTKEFVDVMGIEIAIKIIDYCGGGMLYFPTKKSLTRCVRNRVIKNEFNGGNYRNIANKYGISEMQVRNILKS